MTPGVAPRRAKIRSYRSCLVDKQQIVKEIKKGEAGSRAAALRLASRLDPWPAGPAHRHLLSAEALPPWPGHLHASQRPAGPRDLEAGSTACAWDLSHARSEAGSPCSRLDRSWRPAPARPDRGSISSASCHQDATNAACRLEGRGDISWEHRMPSRAYPQHILGSLPFQEETSQAAFIK
jgi:hypothetical protein